ncbi:MAG: secretin N-terminal domain-containing protein [Acidobacteriaceae bacterium]
MKISRRLRIVLGVGLLLVATSPCRMYASKASKEARAFFKQGQTAEARDDYEAAFSAYQKATAADPGDLRYKTSCERTRSLAALEHVKRGNALQQNGKLTEALTEYFRATDIDPSNMAAEQAIANVEEHLHPEKDTSDLPQLASDRNALASLAAPIELKPLSTEPISIHMTADSKVVYETLGKIAGINVLFDPDYTSKRVSVDIENTGLLDALRIIAAVSNTFWKPLTPNAVFVAADTRQKRTELEQQAVQVFYLTNVATANDLNEVLNAVRNLMDTTVKMQAVPSQNVIVMRGTPDQLLLAEYIIDDLDKARPGVVIDVKVMEVNKDKVRNLGLQWPQTVSVALQSASNSSSSSSSSTSLTLNDLANLTAENFALTVGTAAAQALLTDSDTQIMQDPSLRATDGEKADLKIGERIPIATGSFSTPSATAGVSPLVNTQFQYIDVGVSMDIQPTIHYNGDVTLKIKVGVSSEDGNVTISGVTEPIIAQQNVEETVRLKNGESNLLGGLVQEGNLLTVSGTPGLGEIPALKYLFSTQQRELQHEEIVFLITPHVVRGLQIDSLNLKRIGTGTSSSIQLRQEQADSPKIGIPILDDKKQIPKH